MMSQLAYGRQIFPTIAQSFLHRIRNHPNDEVFHYKEGVQWKALTWKDHFQRVLEIYVGLQELGVKEGDKVCILSNTRIEWLQADMAVIGSKAVTVPIYASNTAEDCSYIFNHCEAKVIFAEDNKQVEKLLTVRKDLTNLQKIVAFNLQATATLSAEKDVLSFSALRELGSRALAKKPFLKETLEENFATLKPSDDLTICYTSGTTGVPKGVVLSHDSLMSIIEDVDRVVGNQVNESDILLSFLPVSHIFGKVESLATYHFGWKVYFAESIEKLFLNISEVKPTLLFAVPRIFEKAYGRIKSLIDDSSFVKKKLFDTALDAARNYYGKLWSKQTPTVLERVKYEAAKAVVFKKIYQKFGGRLKFCVAGGAPLAKDIGEFMQMIGIPILEGYGLTETCAPVTLNPYEDPRFGTIGRPLPEVALKVADDGEILVKSRKVFKEYYKNPQATKEVLSSDGWFHTGDIGIIDDDGYVKITDRKKDLIVTSGGKNVAPQKIENLAKSYKHISQIMVYGDKRNYLTALVVLEKEEVIKYARELNILFSEYSELVKNPKITALVQSIFEKINKGLAPYETIKRFKVLPNEFSVDSGELTPSLKIRRRFCSEKYKAELDSMYNGGAAA
ncbi:MAG: long-chain fatty acid--CoA ligase [Bacteriovoracia bacterium]